MTEPNLVISGLSQEVIKDGIPLRIEIYRLEGDNDWALEIVANNGTSTVWDDFFSEDQKALDEALKTIETENIASFLAEDNVIQFPNI